MEDLDIGREAQVVPQQDIVEDIAEVREEGYQGWDHWVGVHEFASWISMQEFMDILRQLRKCRFHDPKQREKAIDTLNCMGINNIVGREKRFPKGNYFDLDCPELVALMSNLYIILCSEDPDIPRSKNMVIPPRSYYTDTLRSFYSALNEFQSYVTNANNVWYREKFEQHHYLQWVERNNDVGVQVEAEAPLDLVQ